MCAVGKHHIEKCATLRNCRAQAKNSNTKLAIIGGIDIEEDLLKPLEKPTPKPAKIDGFVMSSSALLSDPRRAPSDFDGDYKQKTGKKGYTRCLACNAETYAPNTSRHSCAKRR